MSSQEEALSEPATTRLYPLSQPWMTTFFYIGLLAWAIILFVLSLSWSWENKLFPVVLTVFAIVLTSAKLLLIHFRDRLGRIIPSTSQSRSDEMNIERNANTNERTGRERERYELIMIGWTIVLVVLLNVLGFLYATPLYTFAFIWYFLRNIRTALLVSVLTTGTVYVLFVQVLGIQLPEGLLFTIV